MNKPGWSDTRDCPAVGRAMINVKKRLFVCRCGAAGRIDHFYDADGTKTDDLDTAISAVVELENGWWTNAVLADFDDRQVVN